MTDFCGHCGGALLPDPSIATPLFVFYPDAPGLLGLTPGERAVLGEILRARGWTVHTTRLHRALQGQVRAGRPRTLGASSKSLHVTITRIRAKLRDAFGFEASDAITTTPTGYAWGGGYAGTIEGATR